MHDDGWSDPDPDDASFQAFEAAIRELGFELVATRDVESLPEGKDVVLLHTSNEQLFKGLKRWARRNDAVILYDPEEECHDLDLLAVVMDSELLGNISIPSTPTERFINSGLCHQLIESTLSELQVRRS